MPQAKIILHLPLWFVISSCYGSAMFASMPRIQCNGKTNWTAAEGVYSNSLEIPESFATAAFSRLPLKWVIITVFSIWIWRPPAKRALWLVLVRHGKRDRTMFTILQWMSTKWEWGWILFLVCLVVLVQKVDKVNKQISNERLGDRG